MEIVNRPLPDLPENEYAEAVDPVNEVESFCSILVLLYLKPYSNNILYRCSDFDFDFEIRGWDFLRFAAPVKVLSYKDKYYFCYPT